MTAEAALIHPRLQNLTDEAMAEAIITNWAQEEILSRSQDQTNTGEEINLDKELRRAVCLAGGKVYLPMPQCSRSSE